MLGTITSFNGEYYHGTVMDRNVFFNELKMINSEWEAIWFSEEEEVAREFTNDREDGMENGELTVIFLLEVKAKKIIDLSYEETQQLGDEYGFYDFRESISFLRKKYNGWIVPGSIGYVRYRDMCVFDPKFIKVKGISFKESEDEWTPYMDILKAKAYVDNSNRVNY